MRNSFKETVGFIVLLLLLSNCKSVVNDQAIDANNVSVINIDDTPPKDAKFISKIKVGYFPPYLALYKNYDSIVYIGRQIAAKNGGNILKITSHTPYQYNVGENEFTFHKIKADVFLQKNNNISKTLSSKITNKSGATLNFYMFYQGGASVKVYVDDSLIATLKSKSKYSFVVNKFGDTQLKCGKNGEPITINILEGKDYYLKCNIKLGLVKNTPFIEEKDSIEGKKDFFSL